MLSRLQRVIFPAQVVNFAPKLTIFEITPQSPLSYAILNPRTPPIKRRENRKDERNEEKDPVGLVGSDDGGRDGAAAAVAGRSGRGYLWNLR